MENKQIVDGVDVSGCEHINTCDNKIKCVILQDDVCETNPYCGGYNCYYKQFKAKEQECEELKKANKHIEHNRNQKAGKLMRIEKLITACSTGYTDEFIQELLVILHEPEPNSFENKYKATLTKIKEIAEKVYNDCDNCYRDVDTNYDVDCIDCTLGGKAKLAEQILQKISEVL